MFITCRYRLHESFEADSCSVEGIIFTKEWKELPELYSVKNFLRTNENPKGILEKEIIQKTDYKGEFPGVFERETLYAMDRKELVDIAKFYCIPTLNITHEMLAKLIYSEQADYLKKHQKEQQVLLMDTLNIIIIILFYIGKHYLFLDEASFINFIELIINRVVLRAILFNFRK